MNIQRFIGSNSRDAMQKVKKALGDDALILSNRQVADGIEIIAADGNDEMLFESTEHTFTDHASTDVPSADLPSVDHPSNDTEAEQSYTVQTEIKSPKAGATALPLNDVTQGERINLEKSVDSQQPAQAVIATNPSEIPLSSSQITPRVSDSQNAAIPSAPMPQSSEFSRIKAESISPAASRSTAMPDVYSKQPYTGLGAAQQEPPVLNQPIIPGNTEATVDNEKTSRFSDSINQAKSALQASNIQPEKTQEEENQQISIMRQELSRLRGMMENQFSNMHMGLWAKSSPARAAVLQRMTELGLTESLATRIVSSLKNIDTTTPQISARDALATLAKQIRVTGDKITENGGTIVFIGPAGAGKTTTIAKLALQFTQQHGSDDIVLISTDTSRFGAHEQLAAYGRLLGVPVLRATESDQTRELISAMQDKKLVLVDTAGLTQQDLRSPKSIPTMALQIPNIQHYLVLPATAQYQTLNRVISALSGQGIAGAIMTKLDEAANLGELLSSAIANQLPISYWTEEPKITSTLHIASPRRLVEKAVSVLRTQSRNFSAPRAAETTNRNDNIHHQQL